MKIVESKWFSLSFFIFVFLFVPATTFFIIYVRYGNFLAAILGSFLTAAIVHTPLDLLHDKLKESSKKQESKKLR